MTRMIDRNNKEFILIFLAVICQNFSCMNIFFISTYVEAINQTPQFFANDQIDHTYWVIATFCGRLCGAYFIGRYASKVDFFKSVHFISRSYVLIAVLVALFCIIHEYECEMGQGFYFFRFCYAFLMPASFFLPGIYLLNRTQKSKHILVSTCLIIATLIAELCAHNLKCLPLSYLKFWYVIPLITTSLAWVIYRHLEKHSLPTKEVHLPKLLITSFQAKILSTLIGAVCATGILYHTFFSQNYVINIAVIEDFAIDINRSLYIMLFVIFLLPSAWLCKRFGVFNTARISLIVMFILSLHPILSHMTFAIYVAHQVLFSFFAALFAAPTLAILCQLFRNKEGAFDNVFWFTLGFSLCHIYGYFGSKIGFCWSFPNLGMYIFNASITLSLIALCKSDWLNQEFLPRVKPEV